MVTKKTTNKVSKNQIDVYDMKGVKVKQMTADPKIFSVVADPKKIAQAIRVLAINKRQGTASTKTRGEVTGSTRKIYRQKGTGRARHGDIKAPIFVGGGVAKGPKPKRYSLSINKNQKRQAFLGALSLKMKEGAVIGLDEKSALSTNKTKTVVGFMKTIKIIGDNNLFVFSKMEKNPLLLSLRNIRGVSISDASSLNSYSVLRAKHVIFLESAVKSLEKMYETK